jgi:hypothetical protein
VALLLFEEADILANQNKKEAFRALYVAATHQEVGLQVF